MTDLIRPGPAAIPPHSVPGGIMLHVYSVPDGECILIRGMDDFASEDEVESDAVFAGTVTDGGVCIVVFDGDTGERWTHADFLAALLERGP